MIRLVEKEKRRGKSGKKPGKSESMSNGPRTVGSGAGLEAGRHLTNPVIIDGKLYGQDYKRIKSSPLFEDEKVYEDLPENTSLVPAFSFLRTSIPSVTTADSAGKDRTWTVWLINGSALENSIVTRCTRR